LIKLEAPCGDAELNSCHSERPRNCLNGPSAFASALAKGSVASSQDTSCRSALASRNSTVSNPSVNQP
jgi:hypothetical protein